MDVFSQVQVQLGYIGPISSVLFGHRRYAGQTVLFLSNTTYTVVATDRKRKVIDFRHRHLPTTPHHDLDLQTLVQSDLAQVPGQSWVLASLSSERDVFLAPLAQALGHDSRSVHVEAAHGSLIQRVMQLLHAGAVLT